MSDNHKTELPQQGQVTRRQFLQTTAGALGLGVVGPALTRLGADPLAGRLLAKPAGAPRRGGTLKVALTGGSSTENLNPENPEADPAIARAAQLCDTLMIYTPAFELEYALAESVEPNADGSEWTIRLKDGVEFHNGKTLTASDVIYTFQTIMNPKNPGAAASRLATMDVAGMRALDSRTVKLPFHSPFSPMLPVLADAGTPCVRVIPEGFSLQHPVGTGPFKYQSFTPGVQSNFVRNDNYWRSGQPYVDNVIIIDINDDTARSDALIGGEVDAIELLPNSEISTISTYSNLRLLISVTGGWNPFTMRVDKAPFDDVRVRQAFRLIANRPQLITSVLDGQGVIANDLYGRYDPTYDHILPQRQQDLDEAKSLLRQAGHGGMSIQLVTSDVALGLVESAQVFAAQAAQAGVTVHVLNTTPTTFFSVYFLNSAFSQTYWATRDFLVQAADSMLPTAPYNETHWHNDTWLKYVTEAFATVDATKQRELIHEAQTIEWNEGGYLNWGWFNEIDAYNSRVHGFVPDKAALGLTSYRFREVWLD
jgi:peptide/nickel transport system substrate-binding protein